MERIIKVKVYSLHSQNEVSVPADTMTQDKPEKHNSDNTTIGMIETNDRVEVIGNGNLFRAEQTQYKERPGQHLCSIGA